MSYGFRDGADHPEVQAGIARAEAVIRESDKHLGGLSVEADIANAMIARGHRMLIGGFDTMFVQRYSAQLLDAIDRG